MTGVDNGNAYTEYDKPITMQDILRLREITKAHNGERVSINDFTSEDIQATQKWAYKIYKELGTKSPFFRAWFGDWRMYDKTKVEYAEIKEDKAPYSGSVFCKELNGKVSWNKGLARESYIHSNSANKSDVLNLSANVSELLDKAVLLETEVSDDSAKSKMPNTEFMHSLYSIAKTNDKIVLTRIYIEQAFSEKSNSDFYRAYDIKYVEKVAEIDNGVLLENKGLTWSLSATQNSISDLYSLVKNYDKDFHPGNPVHPSLLNKDGTPKKFYHGAKKNGGFTKFLNWQYFTGSKEYAERYAERDNPKALYEVYLTADKIFDTRDSKARAKFWKGQTKVTRSLASNTKK